MRETFRVCTAALMATVAGCTGAIHGGEEPAPAGTPAPTDSDVEQPASPGMPPSPSPGDPPRPDLPSPAACEPGASRVIGARLVRLTSDQYVNTVKALFPTARVSDPFGADEKDDNEDALDLAKLGLPAASTENLYEATNAVLATGVPGLLQQNACLRAAPIEESCWRGFLGRFGAKAFRRPLEAAELERFVTLARRLGANQTGAVAVEMVLGVMLQSPQFLFRWELGSGAGTTRMPPFEVASALAYSITDGPPDPMLMQAAESGALANRTEVAAQARRLLVGNGNHEKLTAMLAHSLDVWRVKAVTKDSKLFPSFTDQIADDMYDESYEFIRNVLKSEKDQVSALFLADYSFLNERLAGFYKLPAGTVKGTTMQRVALPAGQRRGILMQGSFLATKATPTESDPINRGRFVFERLLCNVTPPPPEDIAPIPPARPGVTMRERLLEHSTGPTCAGCHSVMDPMGLPFEVFDATGRHRTLDHGKPIDPRGALVGLARDPVPVTDAHDLVAKLARAERTHDCLAQRGFQELVGRKPTAGEACGLAAARQAMQESGGSLVELYVGILSSNTFLDRQRQN